MNRILIIVTCLLSGISTTLFAQHARFAHEGVIEFERSINTYALLQKQVTAENSTYMTPYIERYKKTEPQFKILKSTLTFSKNKTLFEPVKEESTSTSLWGEDPETMQNNIVFIDFGTRLQTTQKKVYEETFLVKDSVRSINWKITSETREIAGYSCRRANAIILDSIYVVAFYTDEIPVSGGPESFTGLPGMILGVALPHENVSWFAKIVNDRTIAATVLVPPTKGKPTDNKGLLAILQKAFKSWGKYAKSTFKALSL